MRKIQVKKKFILNLNNEHQHFDVGVHEVDDVVADHYWTQIHADELIEDEQDAEVVEVEKEEKKPRRTRKKAA